MKDTKIQRHYGTKRVSEVSEVSEEFTKNFSSPQRGEGAFVGRAAQMRVRGLILPLKNFSLFTFHFSRKRAATRIIRGVGGVTSDRHHTGWVSFADTAPYRKFGFTLAEVLITLGIIGVVAAVTMPTLIANYQKHETVNRLKETYSILYQAVRMSETENGLLETWEIPNANWSSGIDVYNGGKTFFAQYLKPYIKVAKECKYLSNECWADEYIKTNGVLDDYYTSVSKNKDYGMVLANGSVIGFWPRGAFCEIFIDLNGKKGPNKLGKDAFTIIISKMARDDVRGNFNKSGLYMYGQGRSRTELTSGQYGCSKTATTYAGTYCSGLIMHDGWKISKDYPW